MDRDAAIALYRESLDSAPADRELLGALLRLYGPGDDPRERAFVMERLLELETDETAARLALDLSALLEGVGDGDGAERALRRGYTASPASEAIRDRLIAWYTGREDYAGLADVYSTDARVRRDPKARVEQLKRAALLYRDKLSDPARAATVLSDAATLAPDDVELVEDLCRAYSEAERPADALKVVSEAILRGAFGPDGRARLLVLRARLRVTVEGANNAGALGASISDLDQAAALSGGGNEVELVQLLEAQREVGRELGDNDVERGATMRLAALLPKVGDQRRGLELLVAWVKRNPADADAVRGLGQFAADAEKWSAAAKAYQRLVEITDGREQIEAVGRFAEACERAGTPLDARSAIEQVYRKSPGNEMLLGRLRKMYEAAGAYGELAKLMIAEAEQTPNEDVRFERLTEAGNLSLRVEGGTRVAIDAYRRAYELRPDDHHAVIRLADTLAAASDIEDAANVLDRAIDAYGKRRSPELSELQHAMARVGRLAGDWEAVFAWLDAAVQTDRQNGAAASDLAVIAMDRGELDIAVKALQAVTLIKGDAPMSKAEAYLRQAMIAEQKGDAKKAVFLAKRSLAQDADYSDAKAFLDRLGAS
jgi:tetratricopeptide (TPR) repeat protein